MTRYNKEEFAYEYPCREAITRRQGAPLETLVDRAIRQNFGNIRDSSAYNRILLEHVEAIAALLFHPLPLCPELGGCYGTPIASPDPPSRARRRALACRPGCPPDGAGAHRLGGHGVCSPA